MTNPIVRAWRRFWLCRKWDGDWPGFYNQCLRRRWHRGECEGFTRPVPPVPEGWNVSPWST